MPWNKLSEELANSDVIKDFNLEESRAFVDLAVLVMMVDERVTNEELEELSNLLAALPFEDAEEIEQKLGDHIAYARQTVQQALGDDGSVDDFIEETSAQIEGEAHRVHTLELLAHLAYSDDVDLAETDVCHRIGQAFGFDDDQIEDALMSGSLDRITS
jgi:transcription initiation factor IIF auxiliary subunit